MKPFAVFDIDGTLIRWQLYHVMVDKLANIGLLGADAKQKLRKARMIWKRREHLEAFKTYEQQLIEIYESALKTIDAKKFDHVVLDIIDEYKDQTYIYTRQLVAELKKKGYFLLAISGSHQELVEQIAKYYGFDDCEGSSYERTSQGFSGKKYVASANKKAVLEKLVKKHKLNYKNSVGIGDSPSDIPMLEMVKKPIAFNPDSGLFKTAKGAGWEIIVERKNMIYKFEKQDGKYFLA